MTEYDVVIVGGGVAGLSAGIFTARAGLETLIVNRGRSILARNALLENYPGFPIGINPRRFLDMVETQARHAGCTFDGAEVSDLSMTGAGFEVHMNARSVAARYVIAASWGDTGYLADLDIESDEGFIESTATGRTSLDGLYAAGRLAGQYHQAIIAAGHGAQVALTLLRDDDPDFYNDWTAPEGYFTNRGYAVPTGCKEITDEERRRREERSIETLREHLGRSYEEGPDTHPENES